MPRVHTGLEIFLAAPPKWTRHQRMGLVSNPASVDARLRHARLLVHQKFPNNLKALYSPQHGFFAEKQDNMVESANMIDPLLHLPVHSLYGTVRKPTAEMLEPIDVLVVDLQDVGTRVYTYIYTMAYCLEAAKEFNKKVVVLDRPNPIGGVQIEGNCLMADYVSFVGRYPIPMRHGLTIGELSLLFNRHFGIDCDLEVIPMKGWKRSFYFRDTGLPWVAPSPNLPTPASAMVYPGQVLWEGTNVSEGRGTTQPFELFGAPYFDPQKILTTVAHELSGAILRPVVFEPTSNKWSNVACHGFQLHVTDCAHFQPYTTSLHLLRAVLIHHGDQFQWKPPPYEYELTRLPFDLITGDPAIRRGLENREPIDRLNVAWQRQLEEFKQRCKTYYLYA